MLNGDTVRLAELNILICDFYGIAVTVYKIEKSSRIHQREGQFKRSALIASRVALLTFRDQLYSIEILLLLDF